MWLTQNMSDFSAPKHNKGGDTIPKPSPQRVFVLKAALYGEAGMYTNRGNDYAEVGEVIKCSYVKFVEKSPTRYELLLRLGRQHHWAGELAQAVASYCEAITLAPDEYEVKNHLGNVYMDMGNYREAIACYHHMVDINPQSDTGMFNLGVAYSDLGEPEQARMYYLRAVEINPEAYSAWNNLGVVYASLGDHKQALACYRKVVEIEPEFDSGHKNLGFEYFKGGNLALAEAHTTRALELGHPNWAYMDLGHIALAKGDPDKALELYRTCLEQLGNANTFFPALEDDFQYLPQYGVSLETCQALAVRLRAQPGEV